MPFNAPTRQPKTPPPLSPLLRLSGVLAAAALWEIAARAGWTNRWLVVPPSSIPPAMLQLAATGELWRHLNATLFRVLASFAAGAGLGLAAGLAAGGFRRFGAIVDPLLAGLYATPKIALFPLALALLGTGDASRLLPAIVSAFAMMAVHSAEAARSVPQPLLELARSYGAGRRQLFRAVYVPSSLPHLFTGLRLSLGLTLVMVISTEMLGAHEGIGSLLWISAQSLRMELLYGSLLLCAGLGILAVSLLRWAEIFFIPWRTNER